MTSYGFLFYGPGSYVWYQYLDQTLPKPTVENLMLKVLLNQIVLGPTGIAIVFAWNNSWQGKLSKLPKKYQNDALRTLLCGFRFWIPVSALNFWLRTFAALIGGHCQRFPQNLVVARLESDDMIQFEAVIGPNTSQGR
ncbi:hypothetical protein NL676_001074 [Syzygium grande]|nr:hypothetical protein NL676_001074 [Syzygium grande]